MSSVRLATCVSALALFTWHLSSANASGAALPTSPVVPAYDAAAGVSSSSNTLSATPVGLSSPGPAGPYYVSMSGSDFNPGTQAAPWRTIAHAAEEAGAGSWVLIEGGSYPEDVTVSNAAETGGQTSFAANGSEAVTVRSFNIASSHAALYDLTIAGARGNCVTIQPALSDITLVGNHIEKCGEDGIHFVRPGDPPSSNYTKAGMVIGNAISAVGLSDSKANDMTIYANHFAVEGNDMTGTPNNAIEMWGDHLAFRQNSIHDISNAYGNHNDAFQTRTGVNDGVEGNPVTNLLVEQNRIVNVLGSNSHAFMVEGPGHHDWTVRDNVFQNIGSIGMILGINGSGNSSQNLDVYNNTFYDAGPNDVVEFNSADTGLFADNIVQGGRGVYISSGATVTEDYNLLFETSLNTGGAQHDITANPEFVNASGGDFHLAANSPAINSGDNGTIVNPPRPYDFDGNPVVGIVDRGAYEAQVQLPGAPLNLVAVAGDGLVALSWGASTDSAGVTGYRVYRDGVQVGQTSGTVFTDTGLSDGSTYGYHVVAYDAAGNVSPPSSTVSATPVGLISGGSSGSTYYVSMSGSDSNPGTQAEPWRTVSHAASVADPGSTVLIEAGSYAEDVTLSKSGEAGSPITFEANGSEVATVRSFDVAGSQVAVENLTISGASADCVRIQPALSDVTIQGDEINNCGRDGINFVRSGDPPSSNYTTASLIKGNAISAVGLSNPAGNDMTIYADYLTVQGNDMTGTSNDAIDMWGDHLTIRQNDIHDISNSYGNHNDAFQTWTGLNDGAEGNPVTNLLVEQNRIVNVLGSNAHGFMVEGPGHHDWTVRDNVFQNIGSIGMILGINGSGNSSQNLDVYNNTFYDAGPNDVVEFNSADTGLFADNIVQGGGGVYISSGATVTEDYNLLFETSFNTGGAQHDITANPEFVNASGGDFHLSLTSPAINSGDNGTIVNPPRPYDFDGNPVVGIVDGGAYEYQVIG